MVVIRLKKKYIVLKKQLDHDESNQKIQEKLSKFAAPFHQWQHISFKPIR